MEVHVGGVPGEELAVVQGHELAVGHPDPTGPGVGVAVRSVGIVHACGRQVVKLCVSRVPGSSASVVANLDRDGLSH